MERDHIKTAMQKYFESPEISTRIRGYLRDRELSYEDITSEQLLRMLEELSLVDTLMARLEEVEPAAVDLSPGKKALTLKIIRGRAFVDMVHFSKDTLFTISVCFLNKRYRTAPIAVSLQPFIGEAFDMRLDRSSLNVQNNQPIELAVTIWQPNGTRLVYAVKQIEWRFVLAYGSINFDVELAAFKQSGTGEPRAVGILSMTLQLFPKVKREYISERLLNSQLALEKKNRENAVDAFYELATNFWNDYKSIHFTFGKRLIKLYGENEDRLFIPMSKFVCPLYNVRGIDSQFHALRFVSLIPFEQEQLNHKPLYKRFHTFLASGSSNLEDHCHLLCSLLLGFGLQAYVCWGYNQKGEHKWVMTQDSSGASWFWDCQLGLRVSSNSQKALKQYRIVSQVYTHDAFYANIQVDETLPASSLKLTDETKWKRITAKDLAALPAYNQQISLLHPTLNCYELEEQLEESLLEKIETLRKEYGLSTRLDSKLSSLLSLALANYEAERITEHTYGQKEFQESIRSYLPEKHTFRAFPIQLFEREAEKVFEVLRANKTANELMLTRGDSVFLAIKAKLVAYPDNYFVLWLSLAVRYFKIL